MGREHQKPLTVWDVAKEHRNFFDTEYCLAPEPMKVNCSGAIIQAHTVPRSGSLRHIAREGHVYGCVPDLGNMVKRRSWQPELLGINKASTFSGFCSRHDDTIFSKVEKQNFLGSQEQCFLLAYRALARELYLKKAFLISSKLRQQLDRGKPLDEQYAIQEMNFVLNNGISIGLRDLEYYKTVFDRILLSDDFSSIHSYIIELDFPPPIMCSAAIFPEQDFEGNELQDVADLEVVLHVLSFTSFYGGERGVIVFTWLPECDCTCQPFINSLRALLPHRMTDGLIRFFFEFCENLYLQPKWWENLGDSKRVSLIDRLSAGTDLVMDRKSACLADDGIRYDNWPISDLKAIGF